MPKIDQVLAEAVRRTLEAGRKAALAKQEATPGPKPEGPFAHYTARHWYEATRNSRAFNIPKEGGESPHGYRTRRANGAAVWYEFPDGSILTVLKARNAIQWAPGWAALSPSYPERLPLAIRTLWGS